METRRAKSIDALNDLMLDYELAVSSERMASNRKTGLNKFSGELLNELQQNPVDSQTFVQVP